MPNLVDAGIEGLVCATSSRTNGNMSLSYGPTENSLQNRKVFLSPLGIDYRRLVCAKQIHGSNIKYADEADAGKGALAYLDAIPDTDALITNKKGLPLAIFTADCLAVFLYDPRHQAIGLVHAGWRSTRDKILSKTILRMQELFKTEPGGLVLTFGPAIGSCCYEVEEEFKKFFPKAVISRNGRFYLDLELENKNQALAEGLRQENISGPGDCTFCAPKKFFSFRREGEEAGRMMSVLMLK